VTVGPVKEMVLKILALRRKYIAAVTVVLRKPVGKRETELNGFEVFESRVIHFGHLGRTRGTKERRTLKTGGIAGREQQKKRNTGDMWQRLL